MRESAKLMILRTRQKPMVKFVMIQGSALGDGLPDGLPQPPFFCGAARASTTSRSLHWSLEERTQKVCRTYNCKQYAGSACDELKHVRQAVAPLILDDRQNPDTSCLDQYGFLIFFSYSHSYVQLSVSLNLYHQILLLPSILRTWHSLVEPMCA
ncbi:hypothetical protein PVAP13_4NG208322 [Panicum virgatum]|nr:hypothetical protein PVAP13_4NG208322 [Panicum virgatum]